jgi:crotonobetainyl-CoA:carnitine CoA-transferase CaiB-like acyl-CoA transferase
LVIDGRQTQMPGLPFVTGTSDGISDPVTWDAGGSAPLSGVTVLDMTIYWSGPLAARLLADLGADVVKIEGPSRPDPIRNQLPKDGIYDEEHKWERGWWNGLNVGKRSLALEMSRPGARDLLLKLLTRADILFENFSRRVLPNFDLDWVRLQQLSSSLSLVSSSAFGRTGPYRDCIAFGSNLEPLTGVTGLSGYADGTPEMVGANICDPIAGLAQAGALLTVLLGRARWNTGGTRTEIIQREAVMCALPWAFGEYQLNGTEPSRDGNRRADMLMHDCFPCAGVEQWVAISCRTPEERNALCRVAGVAGAEIDAAELTAAVSSWCLVRSKFEAFHALQAAGVIAAPLLDVRDIDENPHLAARGYFRTITTAAGFEHRAMTYGFRFLRHPLALTSIAPRFGEHNADILREAGVSDQQIADAGRDGVIADRPTAELRILIAPPHSPR